MKGWQALVGQTAENQLNSANVVKSLECLLNTDLNRSTQEEQSKSECVCGSTCACNTLFICPTRSDETVMQAFLFAQNGPFVCYISDVS